MMFCKMVAASRLAGRLAMVGVAASPMVLSGCSVFSSATTSADQFNVAKSYLDVAVTATLAAAQQFLVGPPAPSAANAEAVQDAMTKLEAAKAAIDATTAPADWQAAAEQALQFLGQLSPMVGPYLGSAAPYLPLAIAVVDAFIHSLPPPPVPATPPAALTAKAMHYHPHGQ